MGITPPPPPKKKEEKKNSCHNDPLNDKTYKMAGKPAKTQTSIDICQVGSVISVYSKNRQDPCRQQKQWSG